MDCLIDSIGIIGCGTSSPASGIFINSFAGMSLESIEAIADAEQGDYIGVWADVQKNASRRLSTDVSVELGKRYKLNRLASSIDLGREIDSTTTTTADTEYRGLLFDTDKDYSDSSLYKHSALQSHYIQSVSVYSGVSVTGSTLKIVDHITNTTLGTFTQDLSIGWNLIPINSSYSGRRIAVGIDSSSINSVKLDVPVNIQWPFYCSSAIEGFKWTVGGNVSSGTKGDNSYGMSVVYGVRCSYDNLICNNADLFYLPYAYLCALELTVQRQFSSSINRWTLASDEAEKLRLYYEAEYQKVLTQVCHSITLSYSDCCLECDSTYDIIESIP